MTDPWIPRAFITEERKIPYDRLVKNPVTGRFELKKPEMQPQEAELKRVESQPNPLIVGKVTSGDSSPKGIHGSVERASPADEMRNELVGIQCNPDLVVAA
jgi:hypothetical protein